MGKHHHGWGHRPVVAWILTAGLALYSISGLAGPMDLGGQFAVSESGAATYSIPLQVPPGTAGLEPKLALTYNSQNGNGLLGMGWSLAGLSAITRCPRTMAQDGVRGSVNFDANDRFCLDGQRLMLVSGTYGTEGAEYRTERESFSKIVSYGTAGNGPAWFKVWTKGGQIIEYGYTDDSRIEAQGKTSVRVWAQNRPSDTTGNYLNVTYTKDTANGDYYPQRIDYTGNSPVDVPPSNSVQFSYEARPDLPPIPSAGYHTRIASRLKSIVVYAGTDVTTEYRLTYTVGNATSRSRLATFSKCDALGNCLAPVSIQTEADSPAPKSWTWYGGQKVGDAGSLMANLFGDGRQLYYTHTTTGIHYATRLNNDGSLQNWTWKGGSGVSDAGSQMADLFGEGRQVYLTLSTSGVFAATRLNADGTLRNWTWSSKAGTFKLGTSGWQTADLFGDGRQVYFTHTSTVYKTGVHYAVRLNEDGTLKYWTWTGGHGLGDSGWQIADLFGDGRQVYYTHNKSGQHFATRLNEDGTVQNWTWTGGHGVGNAGWQLADLFGDGRQVYYTHSNDGTHYATRLNADGTLQNWSWTGGHGVGNAGWRVVDLFGEGRQVYYTHSTDGTHFITRLNSDGTSKSWTLGGGHLVGNAGWDMADLFGEGRQVYFTHSKKGGHFATQFFSTLADSVLRIDNGLGTSYSISTKSLSDGSVYTKGAASAYPIQSLQAPFYVASSVSVSNGIGGTLTTNYKYGGLKAEVGTGRGLLGFNWVESTQDETKITTRTTYRQDWPYVGLPSEVKTTVPSAADPDHRISVMSASYSCNNPKDGTPCTVAAGNRYFPYASQSTDTRWELNGVKLPVITTTSQYDLYGNPKVTTVSSDDGYSKTTTNDYLNDTSNDHWILGRIKRSEVKSVTP